MANEVESKVESNVETKEIKEEAPADAKGDDAAKPESGGGDATPKEKEPAPPKVLVHKSNYEKDIVYLYQFSRTPLLPSLSPFCLKVESWLRLAGVKYENVDHKMKYRSKKGQLPFVEINGEEIADSTIIIKELSQKFGHDLDSALTVEQKNIAHATISMVENHLAWVVMWWRTKYPDQVLKGYKVNLQHALGSRIPNGILNLCFKFAFGRKTPEIFVPQNCTGNLRSKQTDEIPPDYVIFRTGWSPFWFSEPDGWSTSVPNDKIIDFIELRVFVECVVWPGDNARQTPYSTARHWLVITLDIQHISADDGKGSKKVKAQGIGVHSAEEITAFGQGDLKVLSDMLADKPFFFGDEPSNLDIVVFAQLAQIYFIDKEVSYALRDYMTESCPNLVGLVNRMKERCFADWEEICTTLDLNSHLPKPAPEEAKDNKEAGKDEKEGDQEKEPEEKDIEKEKADEKEKDKVKEKETEENKEKEAAK